MAFAYLAADKIFSAEEAFSLLNFAFFYVLFDKRGGNLFPFGYNVFYRHIPHSVIFIVGIVLKRGRFTLCARTETEIFAAHVTFYVDMFFKVFKKIGGNRLFEVVGVVDFKHEFCFVIGKHFKPFVKGENLSAALTFGKHHNAEVQTVNFCLKLGLF